MIIRKKNGNGKLAISQIILLVVSIVAIAAIIGDVHVVSAQGEECIKGTSPPVRVNSIIPNIWCRQSAANAGHCDLIVGKGEAEDVWVLRMGQFYIFLARQE